MHFHAVEEFLPHAPLHLLLAFFNFRSRSVIDRIQIRAIGIVEKNLRTDHEQDSGRQNRVDRKGGGQIESFGKMEYGNLLSGGRMIPK
ncbi:hypothetical protein SDC9_186106 [bioreactor metagenome]|uniref:Uncharacterized protein n=1 Tax=bioreactor metagenome TaxID=1076179 RepID=A0A645HJL5_9ZZZZ